MATHRNLSVILVDDDETSAFLTTCQIEESNLFSLLMAFNNARSALNYFEAHSITGHSKECLLMPHVLITDAYMPDLDGFELIEYLSNLCPNLRETTTVCMLTFSESPRDKQKAKELGVDLFFEKPLTDRHFQLIKEAANHKRVNIR